MARMATAAAATHKTSARITRRRYSIPAIYSTYDIRVKPAFVLPIRGRSMEMPIPADDSIRSLERTRRGFILHLNAGPRELRVRDCDRRAVEGVFRSLGVIVVDEFGARIDPSQFEKEADPEFNRNAGPPLMHLLIDSFAPMPIVRWHRGRRVRQSSARTNSPCP
jgi:hypothetical protein